MDTFPNEPAIWYCPNCDWVEKSHPKYGWQKHNDRAVEVHRTQLCPALKDADVRWWFDDDDDVYIFVYSPTADSPYNVAMFEGDLERASDFANMFPYAIYFMAHVEPV